MLNVFKINNFFEEHEFKESNFIWNTDRYLKVLTGNTVERRSLGVPICPLPLYRFGVISFCFLKKLINKTIQAISYVLKICACPVVPQWLDYFKAYLYCYHDSSWFPKLARCSWSWCTYPVTPVINFVFFVRSIMVYHPSRCKWSFYLSNLMVYLSIFNGTRGKTKTNLDHGNAPEMPGLKVAIRLRSG